MQITWCTDVIRRALGFAFRNKWQVLSLFFLQTMPVSPCFYMLALFGSGRKCLQRCVHALATPLINGPLSPKNRIPVKSWSFPWYSVFNNRNHRAKTNKPKQSSALALACRHCMGANLCRRCPFFHSTPPPLNLLQDPRWFAIKRHKERQLPIGHGCCRRIPLLAGTGLLHHTFNYAWHCPRTGRQEATHRFLLRSPHTTPPECFFFFF